MSLRPEIQETAAAAIQVGRMDVPVKTRTAADLITIPGDRTAILGDRTVTPIVGRIVGLGAMWLSLLA